MQSTASQDVLNTTAVSVGHPAATYVRRSIDGLLAILEVSTLEWLDDILANAVWSVSLGPMDAVACSQYIQEHNANWNGSA
ncbi:MAG: hypothetical protein WC942_04750 [Clostridia bacterium]